MMRKAFSVLLVGCLTVVSAAVAGAKGTGEAAAGAPMTISWLGINSEDITDGNAVQKILEAKFNVKLVNKQINYQDTEKLNLMISSGEAPEAMYTWVDTMDWYLKG